jgi:RNA polymerase sigma factor (sigma-70 family)
MLGDLDVGIRLLDAARRGDGAAHRALYDQLAPQVFALVQRVVGRTPADDVFQLTMMRVFERLPEFRAEAPLGRWVRAIALNQCRMHLRSPWQRARTLLDEALDESWIQGSSHDARRDAELDAQRLLRALSPTARSVVWLHDVEGCTHEEIAAAFGRSVSFSKSQLARAHRHLRAVLQADRPPAAPSARDAPPFVRGVDAC